MWFIVTIKSDAWCGVETTNKVWAETADEAELYADNFGYDFLADHLDDEELAEDEGYTIEVLEYNQSEHGDIDSYSEF